MFFAEIPKSFLLSKSERLFLCGVAECRLFRYGLRSGFAAWRGGIRDHFFVTFHRGRNRGLPGVCMNYLLPRSASTNSPDELPAAFSFEKGGKRTLWPLYLQASESICRIIPVFLICGLKRKGIVGARQGWKFGV